LFGFLLAAVPVRADLDFARIVERLAERGQLANTPLALPSALTTAEGKRVALIAERENDSTSMPAGAVAIGERFLALDVSSASLPDLSRYPGLSFHWSPARHLLLDRAIGWVHATEFREHGGGSGQGVAIGIVDTGVDLAHRDLRRSDGSTRVKWWIDFTRCPAGLQPELETEFGCACGKPEDNQCAVFSAADLDRLLQNDVNGDEPIDNLGHGTHVASLAAGNGSSQAPARYVGIAPEADLIVARITATDGGISDANILRAVRFVFERAKELAEPAVVNLSLGSDLGAHDGSSALERALTSFVGPDQPGRAIVVAAGNSAGLLGGSRSSYLPPFGVHTEVHVPRDSTALVPIVTPATLGLTTKGGVVVWISSRPGDALRIGLERGGKLLGSLAEPGSVVQASDGALELWVMNGEGVASEQPASTAAVVMLEGKWASGETFGLRLEGRGTASMWVSGEGQVDPSVSAGPLFPRAQREGTINVPASAPGLIAVGATLNRSDWVASDGESVSPFDNGALGDSPADSSAFFSAAGPNALGVMKPDLVAPGAHVVGAMAHWADPRGATTPGMFSRQDFCALGSECLVVDDFHAVATGTSMAAPLVSGAIALLFERDPSLTQAAALALLQAGARPLSGAVLLEQQVGIGALDLEASLSAQLAEGSPIHALPGKASWLSLAASFARPDPNWPLFGYAELRTDDGQLADGFDPRRLTLEVEGAEIVEPLLRIAPGLQRFSIAAPAESGGARLRVRLAFDGATLVEREAPIAVDPGARQGLAAPRGGCAFTRASDPSTSLLALLGVASVVVSRRRRARA
jgi:subtilisin family serine protease